MSYSTRLRPTVSAVGAPLHCLVTTLLRGVVALGLLTCLAATTSAATAPLNLVQEPAGSGLHSALVSDSFAGTGVANGDDWSFEAETGDRVSARLEATVGGSQPRVRLLNASGTVLYSFDGGNNGVGTMSNIAIPTPGTYRVRVYSDTAASAYSMRVDVGRGIDLEVEPNDTIATANVLTPDVGTGSFGFSAAGLLHNTDTAGDVFSLGVAPAGSTLSLTAQLPSSTLTAGDVSLQLFERLSADRSLDFNGSTYATIPHNATFDAIETANATTIEAWIYIRSWPNSYFSIFDKYRTTGDWGWVFAIQNGGGGISFWTSNNARASSDVTPSLNAWHHVAVAYDHTANSVRFYLDGALIATRTSPGPLTNTDTDPAYIGFGPSSNTDDYSDGPISEVRLWNRALSTAEIQANYTAATIANAANGLVGLWRFDEGSGLTTADATSAANHATLGGGNAARVPTWGAGAIRPSTTVNGPTLSRTFSGEASTWLGVSATANRGLSGRYFLSGSLSDSANLQILGTSFPAAGGTTTAFIQSFTITFDDELNAASANNTANYELRGAGADTTFNTADDITYTLGSPNYANGVSVTVPLVNGPVQPGLHRLTVGLGLRDRAGNPLAATFTREFTVQSLDGFTIENQNNDTFATATSLAPLAADGTALIGRVRGNINITGDIDYYSFNANVGDRVIIGTENPAHGSSTGLYYHIYRPNQTQITEFGTSDGTGQTQFVANASGTHFIRVARNHVFNGEYRVVVAVIPGSMALESEGNDSAGVADTLPWTLGTGAQTASVAGVLNYGDGSDWFELGFLDVGAEITVNATKPPSSGLVWILDILNASSTSVISAPEGVPSVAYTVPAGKSGNYYARIRPVSGANQLGQYGLSLSLGDATKPVIISDTLPAEGASLTDFFGNFQLNFSENLQPESVSNLANYDLRAAGSDNVFGTADDVLYSVALAATYNGGLNARYRLSDGPTQAGLYRFQVKPALLDIYGNSLAATFTRTFTVTSVSDYPLESRSNSSFATATVLTSSADSTGTLARVRGQISDGTDNDYFRFEAIAGHRVIVSTETPNHASSTGLYYHVYRPDQNQITEFGAGSDGTGQTQFIASETGTYYVRVRQNHAHYGEYRIAVATFPEAIGLESESNDSQHSTDPITWSQVAGVQSAAMGGVVAYGDPGDWFWLGFLDVGTDLTLSVNKPASSGLNWLLDVIDASGTLIATSPANAATYVYTIPAGKAGNYIARIRATSGADLLAQYRLSFSLGDTKPPVITADTLPAEGSTLTNFFGDFQLSFSETLTAATVNAASNYDLRAAGSDGNFGTADDVLYSVVLTSPYTNGLSASYRLSDGPTQPGNYRLQVKTGLTDLYGNALATTYTRTFTVAGVPDYILESRSNETFATATSLSLTGANGEGPGFSGTWHDGVEFAVGGAAPMGLAAADFDNDGKIDLATANYDGGNVSLLKGNGDGTFATPATILPAPNQPFKIVAADLNGDNRPDLVVTRRSGTAIRVFLNRADAPGTFAEPVDYATAQGPIWLAVRDLNGDAHLDIATANYDAHNVSILYNNGNGTFAPAVHFPVSGNPYGLAAGDLNNDGRVDLAVGTWTDRSAKVLYRQADGTYAAGDVFNWSAGSGIASVAIADINGDNRADLLAVSDSGTDVRRWHQQANGTLLAAPSINHGGNVTGYAVYVHDINADGQGDVVVGRDNYIAVFENLGGGNFAGPVYPNVGRATRAIAIADFNNDNRPDLASTAQQGNAVKVFLGRGTETLTADGNGFLGRARGQTAFGGDVDVYSFSAKAGQRVIISTENPARGNATGRYYRIYRAEGDQLTEFGTYNGTGQYQFIAPVSGIYYVRVSQNHGYAGEYRIAVAVLPGTMGLESEDNDNAAKSDSVTWIQASGTQTATLAGVISYGDIGDWFHLGALAEGAQISVAATKPPSSGLSWILDILNSSSAVVASGAVNATPVSFTIPSGAGGTYYARVRASTGDDLLAQYQITLTLSDAQSPTVTADTLPAPSTSNLFDRFTLTFSEDMEAATVNNVANYDLRSAGADQTFDTLDDVVVPLLVVSPYTSGLNVSLRTANGATLPVGSYRFRALAGLLDKYGNALAPIYSRFFAVTQIPGYAYDTEPNNTQATATSLVLESTQPDLLGGGGRGYLLTNADVDYFRFDLQVGDRAYIVGEIPGNPNSSSLTYAILDPAGATLASLVSESNGLFAFAPFTATQNGAYALRVSYNNTHSDEYRFRVYVVRNGLQLEAEANNTLATASPMTLAPDGNNLRGSLHGTSRFAGDLDYINLGTLQAGTTVFLSTRQPATSTFASVVSLYNSGGVLLGEAVGGRTGDPVAQVTITTTGVYYAVVRTAGATSGLDSEYLLDVLVVPTAGISFPNLQVTSLTPPPASGLKSGDTTTLSFRVDNLGNLATTGVTWVDRVVLSTDAVYGNADDLELATFTRTGPLNATSNYLVNNTSVTIPDGIAGNFYVIARTDHTNTVNEFVLEGDNETATESPIAITRANYSDLVVENLTVGEPDANGNRLATWTLANRGAGTAAAGHSERFTVRNNSNGNTVVNTLTPIASTLAPAATLARQATFTTTTAGSYIVEVTADAQSQRYEYNATGHADAEANNIASKPFAITQLFTLTVSAEPASGGNVTGGGTYVEGSSRTVTATATSPFVFVGWFEGNFLRSVDASYTAPLLSNRTLVARFAQPTYVISTQVNPAGAGVVTGGGVHALGATVTLTASPVPGYKFDRWSENGADIGTASPLTFNATANRTIVAQFTETNPTHVVTTATVPASITPVAGAGTYANGETATIVAPATVASGENEYVFERFLLNGAAAGTNPSITKKFTTLDPANLSYVAEYKQQPAKPTVTQITTNNGNRVGLTANFQITIRFDRAMNPAVKPLVELVSANATSKPAVPANGAWTFPDTYVAPAITVGSDHGGDYKVRVSVAEDTQNRAMNAVELFPFTIDVTAPALPTLAAGPVTSQSATVTWSGYEAPADLASFRIYRANATFTSVEGLSPIASLLGSARSYGFTNLELDTDYFVAVVPVDNVGNAATNVTAFKVRIASTIPPAVDFDVAALSTNSARITWTFDAADQIGFKGFKIYRHSTAFTSIEGLTPIATLTADKRSFDDLNLDRAQTHHYAVVGYNALGQSLTNITSKPWTDPLSGTLATDFNVSEPVLIINQALTITEGATLTVPAGTVVAFGPGASLNVQSGRLVAEGTVFAPVVFTSLADVENAGPVRGSWNGITLADASRASSLKHVWIKYGKGLAITAGSHNVDTLGAAWNDVAGLRLSGGVSLTTESGYFANNAVGVSIEGGASLALANSVLKNNTLAASASGGGALNAASNWWGTADAAAIAASISGPVITTSPLSGEPILTRGLRTVDGSTSTGVANVPMQFASLNATGYRVSEDSSFSGVLFLDVPRSALSSDLFNTTSWTATVPLSAGGGAKTLYAQFRSPTGAVSPTVSFALNYVTSGPVIATFSLTEGQTINRPINVAATVTSALPITTVKFLVDDAVVATSETPSLATRWDIRALTPGVHRVQLTATDSAGNIATRSLNVVVNPNPPARPVITAPVDGFKTTTNQVNVTGTAEPLADVRILRNGAVVATVAADAAGAFSATNVPLTEGSNELIASAFDAIGATPSIAVFVNSDTGAPVAVTLLPISYNADEGVFIDWDLPTSGEIPVLFRVLWHSAPFTTAAEATGQSAQLQTTYAILPNLPDGERYFAVVGYDGAGNASALSNVRSFTVDLTPPSFTIAYNQAMPVGPGTLGITVTASEPLASTPALLMHPAGGNLMTVSLTPAGGNNYTVSFPVTNLSTRTGTAAIGISGSDMAGNTFTGVPTGPALVFDITKPTAVINTSVGSPIQTTSSVTLGVSLVLSEPAKTGTTPTLSFSPPLGAAVPVTLTGSGVNWSGQLTVTPAMDNGNGTFLLNTTDAVGNVGTVITTGDKLELYNTATPTPPAVPGDLKVEPLKGGYIRLKWLAADKAHSYRLYREAGAGAAVPTALVTSDITALTIDDLPPSDGPYRYVVKAYRLGAESGPSGVRATTSDRTPPPAPTATTAALGATGINIAWTPAAELPAKWVIYRNGAPIRTLTNPTATSSVDSPPRGVMTYAVAAADVLGNEAQGPTATIELLVGAVANLRATVDPETGTALTWTSTDNTGVGYNVYRNGTKQNTTPITATNYTDTLPATGEPVNYKITAVNAAQQESAARAVEVQPVTVAIRLNPADDGDLLSVARYFDTYSLSITAGAKASAPVTFTGGEIIRVVEGETPAQALFPLPASIAANETKTATVVVPAPTIASTVQGTAFSLKAASDAGGSEVVYRIIQDFESAIASGLMISVSTEAPPLAGGLADFSVQIFNRGHAAADFVLSREGNTKPGDLEMLVTNSTGVLVSTSAFQDTIPSALINEQGDAFVRIEPGASVTIPFDGVLVPEGLASQTVTFRARAKAIYHALGTALQRKAGPLEGAMDSSLTVTPYFATAITTEPNYADNQPVIITGKAINRATNQPMANVAVRIGIRVRGAVIYEDVTTDANGNYSFAYTPSLGLAGELVIWAAHPDIVDQLNQARVKFYRIFTKPGRIEAVMSKNDKLDFDIALLNTSDLALTGPSVSFRAYRMSGDTEVPVAGLTGTARVALPTTLAPRSEPKVSLRLQATLDVPDDALFEFTFTTPQGATTKLPGTVSFRPALAVLDVTSPTTGYAEAGLGRGQLKSVEVTVENRGLRDLTAAKIVPPANVPWMQINLAPDANGHIPLGDIPVGGVRNFTVVFAPPADTPVGFYNDFLLIKGENSTGDYRLNLFATVTSEQKGRVQFAVTNVFGNPVPNASVWLRNTTLGTEVGPMLSDVNGQVLVTQLMEGEWQWKTQAAGHGATQGVVTVVPEQTVGVETELTVNMVSVKFSVVPVPFTDYYEIKIEQTFQTRTPIPNLIMSPPHQTLSVAAGWSGTLLYTLRNEGLRSMFDVTVNGGDMPTMRVTPLISFIPELKAQETIQIPVFFEYFGPVEANANVNGASVAATARALSDGKDSASDTPARAAARRTGGATDGPVTAMGIGDIIDCYQEFKYGTISFKAEGGISSLSGKEYTVGVNGTIDVDELLEFVCDAGEKLGDALENPPPRISRRVLGGARRVVRVIDLICQASNIIKAVACAAAQLPSGHVQTPPPPTGGTGRGAGRLGAPDGFKEGGWAVDFSGCFVAGTPITLADGTTLPIEKIRQGARLLANPSGRADSVAQVMFLSSDHVRELTFRSRENVNAPITSLRLTHDHRVWVDGRGWEFAADVKVGDWLHGADGKLHEVLTNDRLSGRHDVYGLHMGTDNVIYAGGVLTEDQCFKAAPNFSVNPQTGGAR